MNPELDGMISRLPDPARWKESPLQDALDPATHDPDLARVEAALRKKNFSGALRLMHTVAARYPTHPAIQYVYGQLALSLRVLPGSRAGVPRRNVRPGLRGSRLVLRRHGPVPRKPAPRRRRVHAPMHPRQSSACPGNGYAWTLLAYYDSLSGNPAEAVAAAQQGTKLAPSNGFMWAIRGLCESDARRYDAAIADYQKAISLNHRLDIAYEGLGSTYAQINRPGDAIAPLKVALALAPGNYLAALKLGYCYLRSGQPADGAKACRQAVTARPGFSKAWDLLGLCYEQLGKRREALDAFRQAVKTGPDDTVARAHLDRATRAASAHA